MAFFQVDRLQPGMILAAEVRDRNGRLLVAAGQELSERHIQALRMWGITRVDIQGAESEGQEPAPVDEATLRRARGEVELRFVNAPGDHPFLGELRGLAVERAARELAQGSATGGEDVGAQGVREGAA